MKVLAFEYGAVILIVTAVVIVILSLRSRKNADKETSKGENEKHSFIKATRLTVLKKMSPISKQFLNQNKSQSIKEKLIMLGDPNYFPEDIISMQILSSIFFGILFLVFCYAFKLQYYWIVTGLIIGYFLPYIMIRDRIKKRHQEILRQLPFSLDLLTLSVEAGLDFGSALAKVIEKGNPGPLNEELNIVLKEIKMGKTREESLRNLTNRVRLPSLTYFVSNLIQAEKMGSSLGRVLRVQSTQLRIERSQRAEKLVNEAPVKLLFPLIFCIFPTVFLILFGPILYQFIE